jgi:hypothetical protein
MRLILTETSKAVHRPREIVRHLDVTVSFVPTEMRENSPEEKADHVSEEV